VTSDLLVTALAQPKNLKLLSSREWEWLIGRARTAQLLARLALRAEEAGCLDEVPPQPRRHLEWARRDWDAQQRALRWDVDFIGRALDRVDTPIVLLKGAAYVMAGLPPALGRLFSDIDIMVRQERLADVETALRGQGWLSQTLDPYDQHYYRTWMHELPPLHHVLRRTVLDVHHTIAPPTSRHSVDARALFAAARALDIRGKFFVLAPPDMLLHSIIHLMQEGEFEHGLRDLIDLDDLFRHFGRDPAFWPAVLQRAAEHRLGRPLYYAAQQARQFLDTPMPAEFVAAVERFAPGRATRKIMDAVLRAGIAADQPGLPRPFTRFSRWLLYVRGHYLRMPLRLLLPHLLRKGWRRRVAP
jgi:hypothetical protein